MDGVDNAAAASAQALKREASGVPFCNSCKYSHGCDLPAGHGGEWHVCDPDEPDDSSGSGGFNPDDPHNTSCFAWRIDDPEAFDC